jgi:hypothetical protein
MKSVLLATLSGVIGLAGVIPGNPLVGIDIRKDEAGYRFMFRNCVDPEKLIGIRRITVAKKVDDGYSLVCQLSWKDPSSPTIKTEWMYGTKPAGYSLKQCEPLTAGDTYQIRVSGAGGGSAIAATANDGSVKLIESSCETHP